MQRRTVALNQRFEFQAFALGKDGDSMVADRSTQQHGVSRSCEIRRQFHALGHQPNSGRVDEELIATSLFYDLGIARHNGDACVGGRFTHRFNHPAKGIHGQAFFEDEGDAQK